MTEQELPLSVRNILVEVLIEAPLEHVWRTMVVETPEWWHPDFCSGPGAEAFRIEPKLGGWMYEDWGDGEGLIWGTVGGLRAPTFLQVLGDSSKEWGGPNRNVMTWTLEQHEEQEGTTRLRLEHSIFGHISKKTEEQTREGWLTIFRDTFKPYAETGAKPAGRTSASAKA